MKCQSVTIQMKATEQYFPVVLFIMLFEVVLTFEFVDEILKWDHSNESYWAVLHCANVYYICCTRCFYHISSLWIKAAERYFSLVLFIGHQEVLLCSLGYIKYSCRLRVSIINTYVLYCSIFNNMK